MATTVSNLQSALLPTRQGRHKGAMSKQQAFCSFFFLIINVRGGNPALFCGSTSLTDFTGQNPAMGQALAV